MRSSISRLAYCTFLDGDNEYVLGVLALARSLRVCACTFKLIVCTTPNITEAAAALIAAEPNGARGELRHTAARARALPSARNAPSDRFLRVGCREPSPLPLGMRLAQSSCAPSNGSSCRRS